MSTSTFDPETVITLPGYRVGFRSPKEGSLAGGELYVEVTAPPRLWVGGPDGTVFVLVATPPVTAPINTNVPFVSQDGDILTCTMGTWTGEPDTYAYQWAIDGVDAGDGTEIYTATVDDVGKTATCVVSATNDLGTTEAPPSNAVVIADIALRTVLEEDEQDEQDEGGRHRR